MDEKCEPGVVSTDAEPSINRLAALFDTHAPRLYRLARRLVPGPDDALDLVQETFLRAARSPRSIPEGHEAEAWLVRVLINVCRDQWRKEAVRRRHALAPGDAVQQESPEAAYVSRATVWRALDVLSPRRRSIVVMAEIEGLPVQSIASLLGISVITVRWHLARGRRELARQLRLQPGEHDEPSQKSLARRRPAPARTPAPGR